MAQPCRGVDLLARCFAGFTFHGGIHHDDWRQRVFEAFAGVSHLRDRRIGVDVAEVRRAGGDGWAATALRLGRFG